jgi:hypothetical protein
MNHLNVFFNTEIQGVNTLSSIGNFFLAPTRLFFSGKTVKVERDLETGDLKLDGSIAKVTSFYLLNKSEFEKAYKKSSKQDSELQSIAWGYAVDILLFPITMLAVSLPFTVIGSIFKAFSYLDPSVRAVHHTVKERLTPLDVTINYQEKEAFKDELEALLMSGQKTKALIIQADQKSVAEMSPECLGLIKKLNPSKVVLVGDWNETNFDIKPHLRDSSEKRNPKSHQWDLSALESVPEMSGRFDNRTAEKLKRQATNIVDSEQKALSAPQSFFGSRHTVYIVKEQANVGEPSDGMAYSQ